MGSRIVSTDGMPSRAPESVEEKMLQSPNVCDQRKGTDLQTLRALTAGAWAGRCAVLGFAPGEQKSLCAMLRLGVSGMVWEGEPRQHDLWTVMLAIPYRYPLVRPEVRFVGDAIPYNPHIIHRDFLIDEGELPRELMEYVTAMREGQDGWCCYVQASQWSPLLSHGLALVLWQVSRILTGARVFGEKFSLNNHARDHYLRLAEPLDPALPYPANHPSEGHVKHALPNGHAAGGEPDGSADACDDHDIEWISDEETGGAE